MFDRTVPGLALLAAAGIATASIAIAVATALPAAVVVSAEGPLLDR